MVSGRKFLESEPSTQRRGKEQVEYRADAEND